MAKKDLHADFLRLTQYFCVLAAANSRMMKFPFFSVITVSFNAAKTIARTAQSLSEYPSELLEWLVIDGDSSDETLKVLKTGVRVPDLIVSEKDRGLYDAMNKGVLRAKGQFLLFLNSDDWLEENILLKVKDAIDKHPDWDVYHGDILAHFGEKVDLQRAHGKWPTSMPAFQPASFIRRQIKVPFPWFDTNYRIAADFKFFKQLQLNGARLYALNFVVTNYATEGISTDDSKRIAELERILPELGYSKIWRWLFIWRMRLATMRKRI